MASNYLILGVPAGGLFLARQLRKAWPKSVIYAIGDSSHDIGSYSNVINHYFEYRNINDVSLIIKKIHDDIGGGKIKTFMCSNPILEYVVGSQPGLFDFLEFENEFKVYQQFVEKERAKSLCHDLGINTPEEYSLQELSYSNIHYPVVVKPLYKGVAIGASKCEYIMDGKRMDDYLRKMDSLGIERENLICQHYVEGNNSWEYGYGGFFKNGNPLIDICFYQLKQVPQGLCCYSVEVTDESIEQQLRDFVKPLLKTSRYNGFLEVDIKQDSKTKELYLLDINPRPWRSVDILCGKIGKSSVFAPVSNNKKVKWRYPYRAFLSRRNKDNATSSECRVFGKGCDKNVIYLYDSHDMKPFLHQCILDAKSSIDKILAVLKKK